MEEKWKTGHESASPKTSSPPTPPSPLPVSVGPGNQKYLFSPSPSLSPPFTPPNSSLTSIEHFPLLPEKLLSPVDRSAFSVDLGPTEFDISDSKSSCLKDLFEWLIERCCSACCNKSNRDILPKIA